MVVWYKNSILASLVSILGCGLILCGVMVCIEGEFGGLLVAVIGVPLAIWGRSISENKAFKKWWKQVTDANLEPQIAASLQTAVTIYNKNPQKRTLRKIEALNPAAADHIRQSLAAKKAAK